MEREILFCITAFQMGIATPAQLREIGKELSEQKIKSIRSELIKRASIPPEKVKSIEQTIDISASIHNYDYRKILSFRIYRRLIREAFGDSIKISSKGELYQSQPHLIVDGTDADIHTVTEEAVDRYNILKEIGAGGIGRVLLSFDKHIGRNIAIKELLTERDSSVQNASILSIDEARFLREARLTAQLEHPSIVPVYEIGRRLDGSIYYTMRYVRGRTLSETIKGCSHLGERLKYLSHFVNLCNAIAYAHSKGVLHRDIKPQNVMIGEFGETVVLDWGLAKIKDSAGREDEKFENQMRLLRDASAGRTISGEVMGTPQYMPPEQAFGNVENIDERSDIYSLGAVLYEILTGFPPFNEDSPIDTVFAVRKYYTGEKRLIPVREEEPECPEELATIAEKALSPKKENRYQSVVDLVDDVEAYMAGRRVSGYRYSLFSYLKFLFKKGRVALSFILILITLSAISLLALNHIYRLHRESRLLLYENRAMEAIEEDNPVLASYYAAVAQRLDTKKKRLSHLLLEPFKGNITNAIQLPSQKILSIDLSDDRRYLGVSTQEGLFSIYSIPQLEFVNSAELESQAVKVAFSPISDKVAIGLSDGSVKVFNLQPFALVKYIRDFSTPVYSIAFSGGGRYMAIAAGPKSREDRECKDCMIRIYSTSNFDPLIELKGHSKGVGHLLFTTYNKYLVSSSYDGSLVFWDIFQKKEIRRLGITSSVSELLPKSEKAVSALLSDGSIVDISVDGTIETVLRVPEEHYLFGRGSDYTITGGGVYSDEQCKGCGLYLFRKGESPPVVINSRVRINNLLVSTDGEIIVASDEQGRIFLYEPRGISPHKNGMKSLYQLPDSPLKMTCVNQNKDCLIIDKRGDVFKLSKEGILVSKNVLKRIFNLRTAYPIDIDDILIAPTSGGLLRYKPSEDRTEELLSQDFRVSDIKAGPDNEYIGIVNRSGDFRLFSKKGNEILNTQQDRKQIHGFYFSPDGKYIIFIRRDISASGGKVYNIVMEEILSDKKEKQLYATDTEITYLLTLENPLRVVFTDRENNLFGIDKNGKYLFRKKIDSTHRVKKILPVPGTTYLIFVFENKRFAALYSLTENNIAFYLFGHTNRITEALLLERYVITASDNGEIIAYDVPVIREILDRTIDDNFVSNKMKYFERLLNNLGIYYAKY